MSGGYEFIGDSQWSLKKESANVPSAWQDFARHRAKIRALLIGSTTDKGLTLCVLGAGQCADLDLESLVQHFSHITLVDIDGELLRNTVEARGFAESKQITIFGDVDVTGVNSLYSQYERNPNASTIEKIKSVSESFRIEGLKQYDVVASTCLLSQLQNHVLETVGMGDQETFVELLAMTRHKHLELMLELTSAGGNAILITDVTSSDAMPELKSLGFDITKPVWDKICGGNHFHGMNPIVIENDIENFRSGRGELAEFRMCHPWLWNATVRDYACIGYCMVKKP